MLWEFLTRRRSRGPCKTLTRQVFGVTSDFTAGSVGTWDAAWSTASAPIIAEGAMIAFLFIEEEVIGLVVLVGGGFNR